METKSGIDGGRTFLEGDDTVGKDFPGGFGTNKDMLADLNARITVYAPKCDTVNVAFKDPTQCRSAPRAKLEAEAMRPDIGRYQVFAGSPPKGTSIDKCVCRRLSTECFSAPRAMA